MPHVDASVARRAVVVVGGVAIGLCSLLFVECGSRDRGKTSLATAATVEGSAKQEDVDPVSSPGSRNAVSRPRLRVMAIGECGGNSRSLEGLPLELVRDRGGGNRDRIPVRSGEFVADLEAAEIREIAYTGLEFAGPSLHPDVFRCPPVTTIEDDVTTLVARLPIAGYFPVLDSESMPGTVGSPMCAKIGRVDPADGWLHPDGSFAMDTHGRFAIVCDLAWGPNPQLLFGRLDGSAFGTASQLPVAGESARVNWIPVGVVRFDLAGEPALLNGGRLTIEADGAKTRSLDTRVDRAQLDFRWLPVGTWKYTLEGVGLGKVAGDVHVRAGVVATQTIRLDPPSDARPVTVTVEMSDESPPSLPLVLGFKLLGGPDEEFAVEIPESCLHGSIASVVLPVSRRDQYQLQVRHEPWVAWTIEPTVLGPDQTSIVVRGQVGSGLMDVRLGLAGARTSAPRKWRYQVLSLGTIDTAGGSCDREYTTLPQLAISDRIRVVVWSRSRSFEPVILTPAELPSSAAVDGVVRVSIDDDAPPSSFVLRLTNEREEPLASTDVSLQGRTLKTDEFGLLRVRGASSGQLVVPGYDFVDLESGAPMDASTFRLGEYLVLELRHR